MSFSGSKKSFSARVFGSARGKLETLSRPPTRQENYRTTLMNLDDYLPQPEEDRKIISKVKQLQGLIETHAVYPYYHDKPVSQSTEEIQSLLQKRLFKTDSEEDVKWLAYNLLGTTHRRTFIRLVIAKALIAAIDVYGNPATSLLPPEIVLFMTAFKNAPRSKDDDQVDEVALCEWRRLGLYLLSGPENRVVQLQNTSARVSIMVSSLDEILSPFAGLDHIGENSLKRLGNLQSIVFMATEIGVLHFGQPCGWDLDWNVRPTNDTYQAAVLNGVHHVSPQGHQQQSSTGSVRSPTSYSDLSSELPSEPRKRRKRLQNLQKFGRSHSTKEQDRRNESLPKDRSRPPIAQSVMRLTAQGSDAPLHRLHSGETQPQYKGTQLQHAEPHYQNYGGQNSTEPEDVRRFKERSRSEPHLTPIWQQQATQHRNTWESPSPLNEVQTNDTTDSFSFTTGVEELATVPDPTQDKNVLQTGQKTLAERPRTSSRPVGTQESFLDGPERSKFIQERHDPVHSNRPPEHSRFIHEPTPPSKPSRPIIYFPALIKVRDEYGCKLPQALLVLEPVVDRTFTTSWY